MLQQTTVGAVLPRYEEFLRRFPDVGALADASEESVLAAWSGLGYYARARNLRRAALQIRRDHGGRVPRDPEALRRLPGFGEYISAAVASLAFGARRPAAEANVLRVLARLHALADPAGSATLRRRVHGLVEEMLPRADPGRLLAALMDLGQTICTPRSPDCARCPLRARCAGRMRGIAAALPTRSERPRPQSVCVAAAFVPGAGRALLRRREGSLLGGMWEFPSATGATPAQALRRLRRQLSALGARLTAVHPVGRAGHTVVHRRLAIRVYPAELELPAAARFARRAGHRWFRAADLKRAAVPALTRKVAEAAGFLQSRSGVA
jgi:A/G-specific adenine glycosylase